MNVTPAVDDLHHRVKCIFEQAREYYAARSNLEEDNAFALFEAEYAAGLDVLGTLVDRNDRFTSPEAVSIVKKALEAYAVALRDGFPLKHRQVSWLIDEIEAAEEAAVREGKTEIDDDLSFLTPPERWRP